MGPSNIGNPVYKPRYHKNEQKNAGNKLFSKDASRFIIANGLQKVCAVIQLFIWRRKMHFKYY